MVRLYMRSIYGAYINAQRLCVTIKCIYGEIGGVYIGQKKAGAVFPRRERDTKRAGQVHIRPDLSREQGKPAGQKRAAPAASLKTAVPGAIPCIGKTETYVVVAIAGRVVVAVRCPNVLRVVVPRPAANDTVGAFAGCPY
jgi:hypothetical protein